MPWLTQQSSIRTQIAIQMHWNVRRSLQPWHIFERRIEPDRTPLTPQQFKLCAISLKIADDSVQSAAGGSFKENETQAPIGCRRNFELAAIVATMLASPGAPNDE